MSNLEKLQYLHFPVRGNAAKIILGFCLKEENLKHCWDLLCERFQNKTLLALSQINKIFCARIAKAYNIKTFLELIDAYNESVRNLNTLGKSETKSEAKFNPAKNLTFPDKHCKRKFKFDSYV